MKISEKKLKELKNEVEKEFPEDYALQQVHLARLIIEEKTKGMSKNEYKKYLKEILRKFKEKNYGRQTLD